MVRTYDKRMTETPLQLYHPFKVNMSFCYKKKEIEYSSNCLAIIQYVLHNLKEKNQQRFLKTLFVKWF